MANGEGSVVPATQPSWAGYIPYLSGGLGALGSIFTFIQNIQRERQMKALRDYYKNQLEKSIQARYSQLVGDAASRGWSGYPRGLASNVAEAVAPYYYATGKGIESTINPLQAYADPFNIFLKSLESLRSAYPAPKSTGINFQWPGMGSPSYEFTGIDRMPYNLDILGALGR